MHPVRSTTIQSARGDECVGQGGEPELVWKGEGAISENTYVLLVPVDRKRVGREWISMRGEEALRGKQTIIAFEEVIGEVLRTDFRQN